MFNPPSWGGLAEWSTGVLATGLVIGSYATRSYRSLTLIAAAGVFCWALHFALRGTYTAAAMAALMSVRIVACLWVTRLNKPARSIATLVALLLSCLAATLTWQGWISLPSTLATLLAAWAGFNLSNVPLRWALLSSEVLWLINGLATGSAIASCAALLAMVINLRTLRTFGDPELGLVPAGLPERNQHTRGNQSKGDA